MIHPNTELRFINGTIGYGVFATAAIPKGTIVYVKDLLEIEISPTAFSRMTEDYRAIVEKFSYRDQHGIRIISWDHAKYVNHRCDCNTISTGYGFEIALRDIEEDEEITDEYGLFNIPIPMEVHCGCPDCRHVLRPTDIDNYADMWDTWVTGALCRINTVYQPLWKQVDQHTRNRLKAYFAGQQPCPSVRSLKYAQPGTINSHRKEFLWKATDASRPGLI